MLPIPDGPCLMDLSSAHILRGRALKVKGILRLVVFAEPQTQCCTTSKVEQVHVSKGTTSKRGAARRGHDLHEKAPVLFVCIMCAVPGQRFVTTS